MGGLESERTHLSERNDHRNDDLAYSARNHDAVGSDCGYREISPLSRYINTGRASLDFLQRLYHAKPFMVARKLHQGGSDDEIIKRVQKYLGYVPSY